MVERIDPEDAARALADVERRRVQVARASRVRWWMWPGLYVFTLLIGGSVELFPLPIAIAVMAVAISLPLVLLRVRQRRPDLAARLGIPVIHRANRPSENAFGAAGIITAMCVPQVVMLVFFPIHGFARTAVQLLMTTLILMAFYYRWLAMTRKSR
ncbi:hypothetical protein GCM10022247_37980 [Allokutzneria multivorans]|uniref:Uncharacterized protein n=1 Tax=Allokutzneria multivorans TaxID=1142134 RepID=A0ABP7SI52_9PSEU